MKKAWSEAKAATSANNTGRRQPEERTERTMNEYSPIIGEKIRNTQTVLFVAVPKNLDEQIYVSGCDVPFIDGTFWYADGKVETREESWRKIQEICTDPERKWANENIVAFDYPEGKPPVRKTWEDYKISYVSLCDVFRFDEKAERANAKRRAKLEHMTAREYYQSKW